MKDLSLKKILGMKIAGIAILLLIILFGFNFFKEYSRSRALDKEIKKLEVAAKEVEAQNLDILNLATYLDTEEFLESEARTKLGLKKPGEEVISVSLPEEANALVDNLNNPEEPNFVLWWKHFFNK
ncbi:septum formation initiator family protein [Candidatus Parcubacteria bacterium]|nr:septum formation initiator family protein [Patescibacteria group bacterium]MCG2694279.1 septum formation initiator family protein [Candidatus Parcubacteria bacterium]